MNQNSNNPERSQPRRRAGDRRGPARRPIKVTPRRKTEIDPHLVSLVYYLIASRIVRDAQTEELKQGEDAPEAPSTSEGTA